MAPKKKPVQEQRVLLGRCKGNLKMGLVGLPNVGKSTTFNLLSKQAVPAENFPFCTIDPHEARVSVPDERFRWLCEHFKPASEVPAHLTIYDIAGLVPGASKGEGLGNAFLSHIQGVDGIFHVIRAFEDADVIHTEGEVNPVKDLQIINDELRFKDEERLQKLAEDLERTTARNQDKVKRAQLEIVKAALEHVKSGKWISDGAWKAGEIEVINEISLLTAKPVVYLVNLSIKDFARQKNKWLAKISAWVQENNPGKIVPYSAEFEYELASKESPEERKEYMESLGVPKSMIDKIITTGYQALELLHYFTCGADEVKCWTVRAGTKAPQAAGLIHSDMEKGFICAEVYKYTDIVEHQSEVAVKTAGKLQQKGKDYVIEDGDIVFYKFNPPSSGGKK